MAAKPKTKTEKGFYEPYADFARNLRIWFIAYGIGAPVLFVSNQDVWRKISASGNGRLIAYLFLAGVAVQIIEAIVYKYAMWHLYVGELDRQQTKGWRYQLSDWVSESNELEIVFDLTTLVLFGVATVMVLDLFV